MMNKKDTKINRNDMLELTRRMTLSRNCFVRAAGAYIDDEGYIDNTFNVSFKMCIRDRVARKVPDWEDLYTRSVKFRKI